MKLSVSLPTLSPLLKILPLLQNLSILSTSTDKQLSTNQAPNELPVVIKVERESPPPPGPERRLESTIPIAPRRSVGRGADRIGAEDFVRKDLMDDLMRIPEGGHR